VWAVALIGVLWTVALGLVTVAGARVVRHRAQAAADLTALAVAARAIPLGEEACRRGEAVAAANGAGLERCAVVGPTADVIVAAEVRLPLLGLHTVNARARAGPADHRAAP
jgi:secretion/DNA translocation related TadE-like protein